MVPSCLLINIDVENQCCSRARTKAMRQHPHVFTLNLAACRAYGCIKYHRIHQEHIMIAMIILIVTMIPLIILYEWYMESSNFYHCKKQVARSASSGNSAAYKPQDATTIWLKSFHSTGWNSKCTWTIIYIYISNLVACGFYIQCTFRSVCQSHLNLEDGCWWQELVARVVQRPQNGQCGSYSTGGLAICFASSYLPQSQLSPNWSCLRSYDWQREGHGKPSDHFSSETWTLDLLCLLAHCFPTLCIHVDSEHSKHWLRNVIPSTPRK